MSTQTPQDQYIQVGQINTRYWNLGDEGDVVVLIHGINDSVESWGFNVNAIAEYHRLYAIDLVGCGHSDRPKAPYTLSYFAQFVSDFMRAQGIDKAILIGSSLGGGVALRYTIQSPDKVKKLVLVSSIGLGTEIHFLFRMATLPLIGEVFTRPSREGTTRILKELIHDPALVTNELIESYYQFSSLPDAQKTFLSKMRASINIWGVRQDVVNSILDRLPNITAPTLILWGQQDRIIPVAHGYKAEKRIPNSYLHIFDRCGHIPQLECAEEFNTQVLKFLAS